jgi:hypothetical protein
MIFETIKYLYLENEQTNINSNKLTTTATLYNCVFIQDDFIYVWVQYDCERS